MHFNFNLIKIYSSIQPSSATQHTFDVAKNGRGERGRRVGIFSKGRLTLSVSQWFFHFQQPFHFFSPRKKGKVYKFCDYFPLKLFFSKPFLSACGKLEICFLIHSFVTCNLIREKCSLPRLFAPYEAMMMLSCLILALEMIRSVTWQGGPEYTRFFAAMAVLASLLPPLEHKSEPQTIGDLFIDSPITFQPKELRLYQEMENFYGWLHFSG